MHRVPIRFKLFGALAVPLVVVLALVWIGVSGAASEVRDVRSQADLATSLTGPQGLITALQDERNWAVVELIGADDLITLEATGYPGTRNHTDRAIAEFRAEIEGDQQVQDFYQPALDRLSGLDEVRQQVDAFDAPRSLDNIEPASEMFGMYAEVIGAFFDAGSHMALSVEDPRLRNGADLVDLGSRQVEVVAELAHLSLTAPDPSFDDAAELAQLLTEMTDNVDSIRRVDSEPYDQLVAAGLPEAVTEELTDLVTNIIVSGETDIDGILALLDTSPEEAYPRFVDDAANLLEEEAQHQLDAAEAQQRTYILLALAAAVLTMLVTWLASRSITRPLRSLTGQARQMAEQRLPDAVQSILDTPAGDDVVIPSVERVQATTRDEVADVASTLNLVQESALDLAAEQAMLRRNIADSFVSLGRRNQNLLERQLDFITGLSHEETDADTLDQLFNLNSLATRMRRNAESLLVLANVSIPTRWGAPQPIGQVLRAMLQEVENTDRVTVDEVDPIRINGSAAADLVHILAELVENALAFSPPDQQVQVRAQIGSPGYLITVIDQGLGIAAEDLAVANERLLGTESFAVAPSRYVGHHVVGRLAARHDIRIELHSHPGRGSAALVRLPSRVLDMDTTPPGTGASAGAPAAALATSPAPASSSLNLSVAPGTAGLDQSWPTPPRTDGLPVAAAGTLPLQHPATPPGGAPRVTAPARPTGVPTAGRPPVPPPPPAPVTDTVSRAERSPWAGFGNYRPGSGTGGHHPTAQPPPHLPPQPPAAAARPGAGPDAQTPSPASTAETSDAVHDYLSNVTDGLQRGLAEARRRPDPPHPPHSP